MTVHSTAFQIERSGSRRRRQALLPAAAVPRPAAGPAHGKKAQFSQAVADRGGARRAGRRGLVWLGLLDRRPVSGLDRRRLCEGRQHHHRAEGLRLSASRCWSAIMSGSRPARCWRGSTTATSRSRSTRPRPTSRRREAAIASKQAQLDVQQAVINAAKATLDVDQATATFAAQENKRYTDLAATGYGSVQNAQQAQSRIAGAQAALAARQRQPRLRRSSRSICSRPRSSRPKRRWRARKPLQRQAELNLGYTTITAPIDGVVGNRTLRVGQFVQAGTQLMSVVPAERRLCGGEFQGDPAHRRARGPGGRHRGRHVPGPGRARPCRQHRARQRPGIRAAAAGQRHRQFHQGGAAHPGEDRARRRDNRRRSSCGPACR